MASGKLSATFVGQRAIAPGRYQDGDGLFLNVAKGGTRSWIVRIQNSNLSEGRRRDFGLGSAATISLSVARERAQQYRELAAQGLDPVTERNRAKTIPTFSEAAQTVFDANKSQWRNAKHRQQWLNTLKTYAFPRLGTMKVCDIETDHVLSVLAPIWTVKAETARRVRQRIVAVLDWAHGMSLREHPIRIEAVNRALPKTKRKIRHHPAMKYEEIADFLPRLRARETMARLALEVALLTACRSGEVRGATWSEVDLDNAVWTIPGSRMKADKPHVVPLSPQVLAVFGRAKELRTAGDNLVFPGQRRGKALSDMALLEVMRDFDLETVPHGFRSAFRDWCSEETDYSNDLAEAALAHTIKNKVEAAYRRGNLLAKRRKLMEDWADYCEGKEIG